MAKTRLEQIEDIYQAAADRPVDSRDVFLNEICGGDVELLHEVRSLMKYDTLGSDFLDSPPALIAAEVFSKENGSRSLVGEELGRYKVESLIGEGGMGEVYLAEDTRLRRRVALKVFPESVAGDTERLMRFEREAQAASALNHPNILTVYEFGTVGEIHYIATEFIDGPTLRSKLGAGPLDTAEALDIAFQAASALAAAHDAGITHRDIKPENIMVRRDGYVKILDFGLAKLTQAEGERASAGSEDPTRALHRTKQGAVMGTAAYMSPEQARGRPVDRRTDIWSLGIVIYEMVSGCRPFTGETSADLTVSILRGEPAPLSGHRPGLPPELDWIVTKTLAKDVEARYQTASELRADLDRVARTIDSGEFVPSVAEKTRDRLATAEEKRAVTADGKPEATDGHTAGLRPLMLLSSGVDGIVRQAVVNKVRFAASALLLLTLLGAGLYFGLSGRGEDLRIDSIAVLPFENVIGDGELEFLADGLGGSLIDRLAEVPQLKVISRNSSFRFRGKDVDVQDAAGQLGVRAVITGSVSRVGDEIVVRVDVTDAANNTHVAGGRFSRRSSELNELPGEIVRMVASKFGSDLSRERLRRLVERDTENSESFQYYLSALAAHDGLSSGREKALRYLERAIEIDPDFALAYAELASIYWTEANSAGDPGVIMPKLLAAAEKALSLDERLAKAHVARAFVYEYEFDWANAEREYRRAIELSPNLDFARNNFAFFLSVLDRQDEALAELEEQKLRDPLNQRLHLLQKGIILVQGRRFDEALEVYRIAQAVEPAREIPRFALGYAYAGKKRRNEAIDLYRTAITELGGEEKYSQPLVYLAAEYAAIPEKRNEARAILTRIEGMREYVSPAILAILYAALDDKDKAFALLEQAYIKKDLLLRYVRTGYEYDSLRTDPRFGDLLARTGLDR